MNPRYTIYIPTKGRWESRLTMRALDRMRVPYKIVIEKQEYGEYKKVVNKKDILVLPFSKPDSNSELVKSRNWIKKYSILQGEKRHWQLDDNIIKFFRYNRNSTVPVGDGTIFRCAEDFVDRYKNVAISGLQYYMFVSRKEPRIPPFFLNTRVYSLSLILNSIPHEWRGVYNDDTDICLRVLKDGWCTVLFNAFLGQKSVTMTVKGGNTPIYQKDSKVDGRLLMAKSLQEQHPGVVGITRKWGRWQHQVNYKPFRRNKLKLKKGIVIPKGVNEYGMKIVPAEEEIENNDSLKIKKRS